MDRIGKFLRRSFRLLLSASIIMSGGVSSYGGTLADKDISLIAQVTEAEAEGESELGKRLVIDAILNRMDMPQFPSTAKGVIYQPGQFKSAHNGRMKRVRANNATKELVKQEMVFRTNNQVVFFSAGGYLRFGYPLLQEGNHYFSIYAEG